MRSVMPESITMVVEQGDNCWTSLKINIRVYPIAPIPLKWANQSEKLVLSLMNQDVKKNARMSCKSPYFSKQC